MIVGDISWKDVEGEEERGGEGEGVSVDDDDDDDDEADVIESSESSEGDIWIRLEFRCFLIFGDCIHVEGDKNVFGFHPFPCPPRTGVVWFIKSMADRLIVFTVGSSQMRT